MRGLITLAVAVAVTACAAREADYPEFAGRDCPSGRVDNFMAARAQLCWYRAPQGCWRILNHEFHYDSLVVDTEATSVDLAEEITRRLTEVHAERFSEILIYVEQESASRPSPVRRVLWTRNSKPEYLDFTR